MADQDRFVNDFFENMLEGCQVMNRDWRYVFLNDTALQHARKTKEELLGHAITEVYPGIEETPMFAALSNCMQTRVPQKLSTEFAYPDGIIAWFDLYIRPVSEGVMVLSHDISDHVLATRQIQKLNRVYAVLSDINQAIVRIRDTQRLFEETCHIALQKGGFALACIGLLDPGSNKIVWKASSGQTGSFLSQFSIDLGCDQSKLDPLGQSLLDGKLWMHNRLADQPFQTQWQAAAKQAGLNSMVSFPLMPSGQLSGVFNLFSSDAGFFDDEELKLLAEMAMDLSFALEFIENEKNKQQNEEKLRASEAQFRTLIDSAPLAISLARNGKFLYANAEYLRLHGIASIWDMLGHSIYERIAPESMIDSQQRAYQRAHGLPVEKRYEYTGLRTDGSTVPLLAAVAQVTLADGPATVGFFQDITEPKQAELEIRKSKEQITRINAELEKRVQERTAELSDLYNNAPCGYHSLDRDGMIIRINDTELNWLGCTREEIIGKRRIIEFFTPESIKTFQKNFPGFIARGWVDNLEFELIRKDGSILPILLSGTAVKDEQGNFLFSRSTMIDYTQQWQADKEVSQAQARLEAANRELEAFAYSVSHDLRAPLRAIDGFSGILIDEYAAQMDGEAKRLIQIIRTNTKKMDHLITDLLAFSRLSRIDLRFTWIDMNVLAPSVLHEIAAPEVLEKFDISIAPLPQVFGDPALIHQVWANLLSNAIKYTLPKNNRRIEISANQDQDMNVYTVKDNGVGFNPEFTNKLFGVFQRLHKVEEFEGTGVGLAFVQRIIQRHGGRVWAEGETNVGASFHFALPQKSSL
jgi:PAS domain S-box-containing protein